MADKYSMRKCLFSIVCLFLAAAEPACADALSLGRREPAVERCTGEISELRGVWRPGQVFLPAYGDLELVSYLASLGASEPGIAMLPVLSAEPLVFRGNHVVFLSTGFILKARSEKELMEAIRSARVEVQTRDLPACSSMTPSAPASFADVRLRLAGQLAGYEDVTVRRLHRRDTGAP
jgi:hypothetical protein